MKLCTSLSVITSLISLLPRAAALVGSSWSMANVPATGLTDITFPITIVEAEHISGYFFVQQFGLVGTSTIGYTGLQPRPNQDGRSILHAVFSSFIDESTTTDPNCQLGAYDGPGALTTTVSCSVEWNGAYNHTYNLEVMTTGHRRWVGTAVDTVTEEKIHIGSFTVPEGVQGIADSQAGFVEWFPWYGAEPTKHCTKLPYQKTIFGTPFTSQPGSVGIQTLAYEYGDCVNQVAFGTKDVAFGVENHCGFVGQTGA